MGFRKDGSIKSALDLLVSQIKETFKSRNYVATLLSFNILGAFDLVVLKKLIDMLQRFSSGYYSRSLLNLIHSANRYSTEERVSYLAFIFYHFLFN